MEFRFLANIIDQLDFALDHIALQDANYKRLALMLIDNAVELALHQHAEESKGREWDAKDKPEEYQQALSEALGQRFDGKLKFGRTSGLLSDEACQSIKVLHSYRNQLYHQGVMHVGILHALAIFYFRIACDLMAALPLRSFSWNGAYRPPHRVVKYIGNPRFPDWRNLFPPVWARLREVSEGIKFELVPDLRAALTEMVGETDKLLDYMAEGHPGKPSRDELVADAQAWRVAFTDEGKRFASTHACSESTVGGYVQWLGQNYSFTFRKDPVPGWKEWLATFGQESNPHVALRKYQQFVARSEFVREAIEASAGALDAEIDRQIDAARGG